MKHFLLCVLATALACPVFGQIRSGTIVGKVTDPTGSAVADAEITVRDTGTNYAYSLKTNEVGEFSQPYLPFGTYAVTVRRPGFKATTEQGIQVTTGGTVSVNIALEVGSVETSVTVSANAVELQTESSRVENSVGEAVIRAIPNINNNPLNYATLQLGVVARSDE